MSLRLRPRFFTGPCLDGDEKRRPAPKGEPNARREDRRLGETATQTAADEPEGSYPCPRTRTEFGKFILA
jgi:hypothetical protein